MTVRHVTRKIYRTTMEGTFKDRMRKLFVTLFVVLFGAGSWLAVNGLWVELPVLVAMGIPEGYNLASYLVILIQVANVGPLVFTVASHFSRGNKLEVPAIYMTLSAGVLACLLLVFFWDATTYWPVFGELRSTALLCLSFVIALVNCTSSVTFIPFMVRLKSSYMTWYFVGQGISALVPSLVALGQGVGRKVCVANHTYFDETSNANCTSWVPQTLPAKFPPENFFGFLFAAMSLVLIAFICLNALPVSKKEYAEKTPKPPVSSTDSENHSKEEADSLKYNDLNADHQVNPSDASVISPPEKKVRLSNGGYAFLFFILAVTNALSNGVLPSIQSYSCGAYGFYAYLLSATLGHVAKPLACFAVMFFPRRSLALVGGTCLVGVLAGGYCMVTALLSPTPPLQDNPAGIALVVIAWVMVGGLFAHVKASIGWILRREPNNHRLLTWYGATTQVGSLIGAVIMFPLINVADLFHPHYTDPCEGFPTCE